MTQKTAWIFDVDGTLADISPFLHHITTPNKPKNYDHFHQDSINAAPHSEVVQMLNRALFEHDIVIVTARMEKWRPLTEQWLEQNAIRYHSLFMRPNNDYQPDYEVKREILSEILLCWEIIHAVDDNPNIIRLWEEHGIPTTKIGTWDGL